MSSPSSSPQTARKTFTTPNGIPMTSYTTFEAHHPLHPDHVGFVVGRGGSTIKGVAARFKVDARTQNKKDGSWPYIRIRGSNQGVEGAFLEIRKIANIANQKIPRINTTPTPPSPPQHVPPLDLDSGKDGDSSMVVTFEPKSPDYTPTSPGYAPTSPLPE